MSPIDLKTELYCFSLSDTLSYSQNFSLKYVELYDWIHSEELHGHKFAFDLVCFLKYFIILNFVNTFQENSF